MKVNFKIGGLTAQVEGATQKDVFKQLAELDVFGEKSCGLCGSETIAFNVRTVEDNCYYSMRCECGAQLQYGQHKTGGTLFAKRTEHPKSRGWHQWSAERSNEQALS